MSVCWLVNLVKEQTAKYQDSLCKQFEKKDVTATANEHQRYVE